MQTRRALAPLLATLLAAQHACAYPGYIVNNPKHQLEVGDKRLMMTVSAKSGVRPLLVMRGSVPLGDGSVYKPGEILTVQLASDCAWTNPTSGDAAGRPGWVFEATSGATFANLPAMVDAAAGVNCSNPGHCKTRTGLNASRWNFWNNLGVASPPSATLAMPASGAGNVTIRAAYAPSFPQVFISMPLMLAEATSASLSVQAPAPAAACPWDSPSATATVAPTTATVAPRLESADKKFAATWRLDGGNVSFEMSAMVGPKAWVAVGFSGDGDMEKSDMVIGWMDAKQKPTAYDYWADEMVMPLYDSSQNGGQDNVYCTGGDYVDGRLTIKFTRKIATGDKYDKDLSKPIFLIYAYGGSVGTGALPPLTQHTNTGKSPSLVTLTDQSQGGTIKAGSVLSAGFKAHAVLMLVAWVCLLLPGAAAARYRFVFPALGQPAVMWWKVHGGGQVAGSLLAVAGAVCAVATVGGVEFHGTHHKAGLLAMLALVLQLILGLSRPEKEASWRKGWLMAHQIAAAVGLLAAIVAILTGSKMTMAVGAVAKFNTLLLGLLWFVLLAFGEVLRCKHEKAAHSEGTALESMTDDAFNASDEMLELPQGDITKIGGLPIQQVKVFAVLVGVLVLIGVVQSILVISSATGPTHDHDHPH